MAFEDYLNDLCDIYHAQKGDESPGYGLTEQPSFSYPKEPDELSVACHFAVKSESTSISQTDRPTSKSLASSWPCPPAPT